MLLIIAHLCQARRIDVPSWPERDIDRDSDEKGKGIETVDGHLICGERAEIALSTFDDSIDRADLQRERNTRDLSAWSAVMGFGMKTRTYDDPD